MYIEPNTIIRILHNCPLDKTYDHTIYFGSENAQISYFQGLTKYTFTEQTYQRVQRGKARVQRKAEDLYDCNYMMFQNSSFGNKWFYAFITGVEYVNNITSEISFEIDVMQTWFFDYTLEECFVEREHSVTDNIGDNLVPENLELGDYFIRYKRGTNLFGSSLNDWCYMVVASFDKNGNDAVGKQYQGVYSGLVYNFFENYTQINDFLEQYAQKAQTGVVTILQIPKFMYEDYSLNPDVPVSHTIDLGPMPTTIGDYTPKNKKLLTYPYNFLYVTNYNGNSATYKYEYFYYNNPLGGEETTNPTFDIVAGLNTNPTFVCIPRGYKAQKNVGISNMDNPDEKLTLSGLPHCAYNVDAFKAWLAQNSSSLAVNALSSAMSWGIAAGSVTGGAGAAAGATAGLINSVASSLSQVYQASIRPPQANGEQGSITNVNVGLFDFGFYFKQIRPEFARIIDDYFNMYGYATHRVKTPNRTSRPYWNFVKTIGCVVTGSIPADDMYKICEIYDRGITFWKNGANVGNYSLDNRP